MWETYICSFALKINLETLGKEKEEKYNYQVS